MSGKDDAEDARRYTAPYSARHPIPTISKYREERAARQEEALHQDEGEASNNYELNRGDANYELWPGAVVEQEEAPGEHEPIQDTSQTDPNATDPKLRRKKTKKGAKEKAERVVTDPVTHLPITIQDFTNQALEEVDWNPPQFGSTKRTATGSSGKRKSAEDLVKETHELQRTHDAMASLFPPPEYEALSQELANISKKGVSFGLAGVALVLMSTFTVSLRLRNNILKDQSSLLDSLGWTMLFTASGGAIWLLITSVTGWMGKKIEHAFQGEVWDAHRRQNFQASAKHEAETTVWLNSLVGSVWPLINPDLFASLADTLEDVMQASLPSFIRMVSVEDIGQGSEPLRILGIRWLPTGAATRAVGEDGKLLSLEQSEKGATSNNKDDGSSIHSVQNGMEAEDGDFVNLEIAFAYRARPTSKSLKERTKNMHIYLAFYLPGNVKVPVWVDLQGIVGTLRLRLQLTPDPPFFSLCTLTFLGQPKVNLSCVPLNKRALNIMDIPFISNFVQSAIDAAMAEYVAPKSLTLDLKDMLAGDDFKKDTVAVGVIMVRIKRGYNFKIADAGIPVLKDGSSDPYVSVGWAKFGKVVSTTRVLENEMEPYWDETFFIPVTPQEVNIGERLRIQLWDSDRLTADDDLGRIEVSLRDLMTNSQSNGKMVDRTDGFRALKSGDTMPGKLEWSVGYFSKTTIQQCQFDQQTHDPKIRSMEQLTEKVNTTCERKLRETMFKDGKKDCDPSELEKQKTQMLKEEQDAMIITAPPPEGHPSGLFSLQIHNITGLEVERLNKREAGNDTASDEEEAGEGLPSAYCSIIINHRKTFRTRTKPQNGKPFYNAGCERFIRDWKECEVFVAVRDARLHEDDPLLGIVHLPLGEIFKKQSQVMGFYPLSGGIGRGRIRLSMVWRSVEVQVPQNLLGWQYGTIEIQSLVTMDNCPKELRSSKLRIRTSISAGKMYITDDVGDGKGPGTVAWCTKRGRSVALAVQNRFSNCLSIAFRDRHIFKNGGTPAFSVLWLKDLVDDQETELELPVWRGNFARATACCLEECGVRLGTLKLKVTFWSGLGSAHAQWASRDQNLRDVIEVIETARDGLESVHIQKAAGIISDSDSLRSTEAQKRPISIASIDDSSSSSSESDHEIPDGSSGNKQGPIDRIRDYKRRDDGLHRQHRGLMQWKAPRTARWIKHKFDRVGHNVSSAFDHSSKQPGIETEV